MTDNDGITRLIGLAFRTNDGTFHEERVPITGDDDQNMLAEADWFGRNAGFGREYLGLTGRVESFADLPEEELDEGYLQWVREVDSAPQLEGVALDAFLADYDLEEIPDLGELEHVDGLPDDFWEVEWWNEQTAYGHGSPLGIAIMRCCSTDPAYAGSAALSVIDSIFHQGSLYPAAVTAFPFLVDLIICEEVRCRRVLASGLLQIVQAVAEVPDRGKVVETFERIGSGFLKLPPLGRDELVDAMRRHVDTARDIRDMWLPLAARLADVADDKALGPNVARALETLRYE